MSGAIGNGFGIMPTLMRSIDQLSSQNAALTQETSSGVVSGDYAGLGDQARLAISLEPQITATNAWQTNITQAQTKLSATQTALTSIGSIATNLQTTLVSLQGTPSATEIATASSTALQQLTQLTSLLNTQTGNGYVFASTASHDPPVVTSDLSTSSLVQSIMNSVASVGTTGATATESATLNAAGDNTPGASVFSAQLSVPATSASALVPQVQIGSGLNIATGVVATQGGASGSQSTGSPIRDLIRGLATVAGLSSADSSSPAFQTLVSDTYSEMQGTTQDLTAMAASVGQLQDTVTTQSGVLSNTSDALQSQLSAAKDSDPATLSVQMAQIQNQLTASYTLIADMKNMTLAQYL
jgi:flagellar hook-associated protein 3 FlgL